MDTDRSVLWQRDGLNASVQIVPDPYVEGLFVTRILLDDICNIGGHPVALRMANCHIDELVSLLKKSRKAIRKLEDRSCVAEQAAEPLPAGMLD